MKPFWKSKTFWVNSYHVLAYALKAFNVVDMPALGAEGLAVANLVLRYLTTEPISVNPRA